MENLDCPFDFTSRCSYGRCDCKPKANNLENKDMQTDHEGNPIKYWGGLENKDKESKTGIDQVFNGTELEKALFEKIIALEEEIKRKDQLIKEMKEEIELRIDDGIYYESTINELKGFIRKAWEAGADKGFAECRGVNSSIYPDFVQWVKNQNIEL